jgi:hypothetical protein
MTMKDILKSYMISWGTKVPDVRHWQAAAPAPAGREPEPQTWSPSGFLVALAMNSWHELIQL